MASTATPYKNQHYSELKRKCLEDKKLFEDPEFPVTNASLFYKKPPPGRVEWKRPREITGEPHLFVDGISSDDLNQGALGNCWFVAACSCLALKPDLWHKVIPHWKEQEWDSKQPDNYAGIFHFRFWVFGEWLDVVVDDRLPTINDELIYCHSKANNEFWSALLEKAYAKLSGCYESLDGGNTGDAVVDFSGAVAEAINLEAEAFYKDENKMTQSLKSQLSCKQGCQTLYSPRLSPLQASPTEREARMACGLMKGHAYSVTAVKKVRLGHGLVAYFQNETIPLIRMRNPWGKVEWNGPWSDSSAEWEKVGSKERGNLGITVKDDGEFWMAFTDWCKYFTEADVCRLINTSLLSTEKTWHEVVHFGSWTKDTDPLKNRSGGCMNHKQTFLQNPQYLFDVTKEIDEVLISLQQKDMKIHKSIGQGENLTIGFAIFKVELNRKYRMHDLITQTNVQTSTYINSRTVFMRVKLPKGRYVIIPTTFQPQILGDFMLRLYSGEDSGCRELTGDKPSVRCWTVFTGYPQVVTQLYIHGAEGLENQDSADPYVIVSCEGSSIRSTVKADTLEPVFDTRAIFYRKKPTKPITVEVWNSNAVKDQFMGQVVLTGSAKDSTNPQRLNLRKSGRAMADEMPGSITLRIVTTTELTGM
uniref:Calpain 6 n=1 Tax=Esox lucius TaxID=8010 RepID=A0AAY5KUA5_ESOLU